MSMKVIDPKAGHRVVEVDLRSEAMALLEQGYMFYEVAEKNALAEAVMPDQVVDTKHYFALMPMAGG